MSRRSIRNEQDGELDGGPHIVAAGDSAFLVRCGADQISSRAHSQVLGLQAALEAAAPVGVQECVPAYTSLLVVFDPLITSRLDVCAAIREAWRSRVRSKRPATRRIVRVPVRYGGTAGMDLEEVARLTGLSPQEVIRCHASGNYRVYFLGFLAGYPYLGGLPAALAAVPRLDVPRTSVPAGSIAIADGLTGIYPVSSPGGWRVIGCTEMPLFDAQADPPAVFAPGDRVRFVPVIEDSTEACAARGPASAAPVSASLDAAPVHGAIPWLKVVRAGPLATVQDLGRTGYARYGVAGGGAADPEALRRGNLLVGNRPDEAGVESTLGGATFEVIAPCRIAVTGAVTVVTLDGRRVPSETVVLAEAGSELTLGSPLAGLRLYLCVAGGVAVSSVLGSRSTDIRGAFGGLGGRPLRVGDMLWRACTGADHSAVVEGGLSIATTRTALPEAGGCWTLRVTPGPHAESMPAGTASLLDGEFIVDSRSDRMGIRLRSEEGSTGVPEGGQILSTGVPRGAIQVPRGGEPVILGADGQTTGGYRVPLVVATVDWWQVGQARPGDHIRLRLVSEDEAIAALRWRRLQESERSHRGPILDVELLMRGFAEWYDA